MEKHSHSTAQSERHCDKCTKLTDDVRIQRTHCIHCCLRNVKPDAEPDVPKISELPFDGTKICPQVESNSLVKTNYAGYGMVSAIGNALTMTSCDPQANFSAELSSLHTKIDEAMCMVGLENKRNSAHDATTQVKEADLGGSCSMLRSPGPRSFPSLLEELVEQTYGLCKMQLQNQIKVLNELKSLPPRIKKIIKKRHRALLMRQKEQLNED